ncbi:sorting nexin-4-like [Oncorhynchus nerka]|uniref:sorting nexin-4-like n=1 Tax=Oncorhynchus nerka TaxID=8023 RepID=UPI0031B82E98
MLSVSYLSALLLHTVCCLYPIYQLCFYIQYVVCILFISSASTYSMLSVSCLSALLLHTVCCLYPIYQLCFYIQYVVCNLFISSASTYRMLSVYQVYLMPGNSVYCGSTISPSQIPLYTKCIMRLKVILIFYSLQGRTLILKDLKSHESLYLVCITQLERRMADAGNKESAPIGGDEFTNTELENNKNNTMVEEGSTLLRRMEISVAEAEKRTGKNTVNMQEIFTVYLIETRPIDAITEVHNPAPDSLWRRYSEFEILRNYLLVTYPFIVVPPLPEKRAEFVWHKLSADNMDPDFVERRRVGLENFLLRVASHSVLSNDKILYHFLTEEHRWKEVVYETGFQAKADSRIKALSATFRVKNPDKRFTEMKHYSDELQSLTSQLLRVRARVADRLYGVYKVHGNYGRVFSEWSALEKEMGDGLQSAGHHMDAYAASVDDMLEEEEHYADQLKEYLFYAEALRAVCRKHELTQYELETASSDLISKKQQREELATGMVRTFSFKGMTNKLFGQETPEQREAKLSLLEEQIVQGEETVTEKTVECEEYVKGAWVDMQRFKEQKDRDLREALIGYAVMQISMCKKGIQVWTNAKECFHKM